MDTPAPHPPPIDVGVVVYDPASLGNAAPLVRADLQANARLKRTTEEKLLADIISSKLGPAFKIRPVTAA